MTAAPSVFALPARWASGLAFALGAVGLLATLSLLAFFMGARLFGAINDVGIGFEAALSAILAVTFLPAFRSGRPSLGTLTLVAAGLGAFLAMVGTLPGRLWDNRLHLGRPPHERRLRPHRLWALVLNITALQRRRWPSGLAWFVV
jgi:hypothetical protein